jgi:hypothetical protein
MSKIVPYLEERVRKSLVVDVKDVALFHSRRAKYKKGGFFGIPRLVFCYVEFLGKLAYGQSGTESAELFIKNYFPGNYRDYAELIYAMCRHGTVHELVPKIFYAEFPSHKPRRIKVEWQINNDNLKEERNKNMTFSPVAHKKATLRLVLNTCQLADDLILAFEHFVNKLKIDKNLQRTCQQRLTEILRIKDANHRDSIPSSRRRLAVSSQILSAWSNRTEQVNKSGKSLRRT